jgi:hypothetical protein
MRYFPAWSLIHPEIKAAFFPGFIYGINFFYYLRHFLSLLFVPTGIHQLAPTLTATATGSIRRNAYYAIALLRKCSCLKAQSAHAQEPFCPGPEATPGDFTNPLVISK